MSYLEKAKVTLVPEISVGDWIRDSLNPWEVLPGEDTFQIGIVIPSGFDRYVLVRHSGPGDSQGCLGEETLKSLIEVLSAFTTTPEDCFFALWEGQGWMHRGSIYAFSPTDGRYLHRKIRAVRNWHTWFNLRNSGRNRQPVKQSLDHLDSHSLPDAIMESPRLQMPNRNYLLMKGAIEEGNNLGYQFNDSPFFQSPNLMWPMDHSWIMASEIDFDMTLLGGSSELVDSILQATHLVTQEFEWSDSVAKLGVHEK